VATTVMPNVVAPVIREWSMDYTMVHKVLPLTRLHVRRQLTMWKWAGEVEDAVLTTSELVTNAINHAHAPGCLGIRLALLEDNGLCIDVSDSVAGFPRFGDHLDAGPEDERGRGLLLLRRLGIELSWFLRSEGKTVRAHLRPFSEDYPAPSAENVQGETRQYCE
jgi:anti-sigma regulatory factor (Ser/Thr protein kinase)